MQPISTCSLIVVLDVERLKYGNVNSKNSQK